MSLFQDHRFSAFFTRLFPFDDSCTVRAHYDFANVTFHLVSRRQYCQLSVLLTLTLATNLQTQCIFKTINSFHHTLQGCKIDQNNKLDFANIQRTLFFFSPIVTDIVFARFNILVTVATFCRMLSFWFELSARARQSRAKPVIELVITCWSL